MIPTFPWAAVLGQERLKLALLLCAIDPAIGGVLVRGPRGVAKTTLARAFAELLPGRFVELPLGATEERVTGSLDLGRALGQGEVHFAPGLLARAHDGVLYVDEVNLLPDALVDLLLDAAASGTNVIERDGVSHVHPARFVLVGTMNPEEGDLRPQLLDRFGLCVDAEPTLSPDERTEIVLRRLEFERDVGAFLARFEAEQRRVLEDCQRARGRAGELPFAGPGLAHAAELCHAAGVDGVRADLAMLRAARAHAAWLDHSEIQISDVDAVADLALEHRRRLGPSGPGSRGNTPFGSGPRSGPVGSPFAGRADAHGTRGAARRDTASRDDVSREAASPDLAGGSTDPARCDAAQREPGDDVANRASHGARHSRGTASDEPHATTESDAPRLDCAWKPRRSSLSSDAASGRGDASADPDGLDTGAGRGALRPVPVRPGDIPRLPDGLAPARARRSQHAMASPRQRRARGPERAPHGAIDWFATLSRSSRPSATDLRRRQRALAPDAVCVIALDCSASMLRSGALASAKAVAAALAEHTRRARHDLALLSFGGVRTHLETATRQLRHDLTPAIASLPAGGATPLRLAVQHALQLCRSRGNAASRRLILLTDARTRDSMADLPARRDVDILIIDCERGPIRLCLAPRLAAALSARLIHLDALAPAR